MKVLLILAVTAAALYSADAGVCPKSHPNVYYNGKYCCASTKEKHYKPQGTKCDGSAIERDSLCCEGDRFKRCPSGICQSYGKCPTSHPYVYYNGKYCCKVNKEKHYKPQKSKCDGSVISRSSLCCERDQFTRCPSGICNNAACAIRNEWDYWGADMKGGRSKVARRNVGACIAKCRRTKGCRSLAYRPSDGTCWLKHTSNGARSKAQRDRQSVNMTC